MAGSMLALELHFSSHSFGQKKEREEIKESCGFGSFIHKNEGGLGEGRSERNFRFSVSRG
jgi:hypothetical protein